jgi:Acetyltransferase (GNAT) domain
MLCALTAEAMPSALAANVARVNDARLSTRLVKTVDGLLPFVQRWEALAATALEPNVFYEAWQVIAALQNLNDAPSLELLLVVDEATAPPNLCGVFALERSSTYRGLPLASLRMWQHKYLFLCTPLVSRTHAHGTLHCFLSWLASAEAGCEVMSLQGMRADGPFADVLKQALGDLKRPHFEEDRFDRALLEVDAAQDGRAYMDTALSKKKIKEYRRLAQRLSEQGDMRFDQLQPGADLQPWLDEFLGLEASGWKGREGSAFASTEPDRRYFTEIVTQAHARGRLALLALRLNGVAIAMKCNFVGSDGAWSFKIGFEEKYARYSPGVLLELENIRVAFDERSGPDSANVSFPWMDSCAKPGHPMIDHLWRSSRSIATHVIAAGGWRGKCVVSWLPVLLKLKRQLQGQRHKKSEETPS